MSMNVYASLLRPVLFRMPADTAHELARVALRHASPWRALARRREVRDARLATDLDGLPLSSPIGLAPGFDKNGDLLPGLMELGFGYVVVGSLTPEPRSGNPRPRLTRHVAQESLANCMGMPNVGLEEAVRLLARPRHTGTRVIASVAGFSPDELLRAAAAVEDHVDAVEIGLVCRHTPETFEMAELPAVQAVAEGLRAASRKPVFVKIPPHFTEAELRRTRAIVDCWAAAGLAGVSLSGTRTIEDPRLSQGRGGLAGRATTSDALRIVRDVAAHAGGRIAIKAAGGVFTGADAHRFLEAGASAIEVYSAFVYRGWGVAGLIGRELLRELEARDVPSVRDLHVQAAVPAAR
jgi:dihydroorotate dehydrogenase